MVGGGACPSPGVFFLFILIFFIFIFIFDSLLIIIIHTISLRVGVGLVGAIVVGPRMGRFDSAQKVPASGIKTHSLHSLNHVVFFSLTRCHERADACVCVCVYARAYVGWVLLLAQAT
jgi:hypothetical protein